VLEVMLRITLESQTLDEVVLEVAGWLAGEEVELMEQEMGRWYQEGRRLVLDLEAVKYIDESGLALLKRWAEKQLVLRGGSTFVSMLLKSYGLA
jgi:anti-anti-sigma factor